MVPPLDALGAESAALSNATTLLALVGYLIQKAREVRRFRRDCLDLTDTCINLSLAYLENERELKETRSVKDLAECLQSVYLLVLQCREWNVLQIQKTFDIELLVCLTIEGGACVPLY